MSLLDAPIKIVGGYSIEFGIDQTDHLPLDLSIGRLDARIRKPKEPNTCFKRVIGFF